MENKKLTIQERAIAILNPYMAEPELVEQAYIKGATDQQAEFIKLIERHIDIIEGNGHTVITVEKVNTLRDLKMDLQKL